MAEEALPADAVAPSALPASVQDGVGSETGAGPHAAGATVETAGAEEADAVADMDAVTVSSSADEVVNPELGDAAAEADAAPDAQLPVVTQGLVAAASSAETAEPEFGNPEAAPDVASTDQAAPDAELPQSTDAVAAAPYSAEAVTKPEVSEVEVDTKVASVPVGSSTEAVVEPVAVDPTPAPEVASEPATSSAEAAVEPIAGDTTPAPEVAAEPLAADARPATVADKSAQLHMLISQARGTQEGDAASPVIGGHPGAPTSGWASPVAMQATAMPPAMRYLQLRVQPGIGAGLSLRPTQHGMLVEDVEAEPGQPGLNIGDHIAEIGGQSLQSLMPEDVKEIFGKEFRDKARLGVLAPSAIQDTGHDSAGGWPEAVEVGPAAGAAGYPLASTVDAAANGRGAGDGMPVGAASGEPAGGLMELVDQLTQQLSNETLRREHEESELQERRREEVRMREELEARRLRRADVRAAAEDAAKAAAEAKRQHGELIVTHAVTQKEVSQHEAELKELQKAALARSGRDWARDGPEKDALVQTKLQIAEAHDLLAQVRLQLRLNRDGLRRQLSELQAENCRLRASLPA